MAEDFIGFRVPAAVLTRIDEERMQMGITRSEWLRAAVMAALDMQPMDLGGVDAGYHQARALASQLAHRMLGEAQRMLPSSYEEAVARLGGLSGPGRSKQGVDE